MTDTNINDVATTETPAAETAPEKKPVNKKKLIIIIVAAVLGVALIAGGVVLALSLLGGETDFIADVNQMYLGSNPTKVVSKTTQTFGDTTLNGTYSLTTGIIGGKNAAVYEEKYQDMRSVEEGGEGTTIYGPIADHHNLFHYIEGKGTRQINPETLNIISDWDPEGRVFSIKQEGIIIALSAKRIENEVYENNTLTCVVPADNTAAVLGQTIAADVNLTIKDNGAQIISVTLEYVLPADGNVQETTVVIEISYTYDNERIYID